MIEITKCPVCGGTVPKIKEDWLSEYQGQEYTVPDLEYYLCDDCGERIYPREAMQKIEAYSPAFQMLELSR